MSYDFMNMIPRYNNVPVYSNNTYPWYPAWVNCVTGAIVNTNGVLISDGEHHPIKISECPKCGEDLEINNTNYKGICKCWKCSKEVYVW